MAIELIDTLWNVNRLMTLILDEIAAELIDTLWNVNEVKVVRNKRPQAN